MSQKLQPNGQRSAEAGGCLFCCSQRWNVLRSQQFLALCWSRVRNRFQPFSCPFAQLKEELTPPPPPRMIPSLLHAGPLPVCQSPNPGGGNVCSTTPGAPQDFFTFYFRGRVEAWMREGGGPTGGCPMSVP